MIIVIEGLDGSGKSTQSRLLTEKLNAAGMQTRFLHFPRLSQNAFGEAVAMLLRGEFGALNDVNPYLSAMVFAADQYAGIPLLTTRHNEVLILDRYYYSNIAYHAAKIEDRETKESFIRWLENIIAGFGLPKPDRAFYLDVPSAFRKAKLEKERTGSDREYLKGSSDIYEKDFAFQERVKKEYQELCRRYDELYCLRCIDETGMVCRAETITQQIFNFICKETL
jgi:dTMP kinase